MASRSSFCGILAEQRSRRAMIALFLAVLEMVRMQAVEVCQPDLFGEIALRRQKIVRRGIRFRASPSPLLKRTTRKT